MVHSLFVPLFFANIGLKIDFLANFDLLLVAVMCCIGIAGRYFGAWLGVTWSKAPRINRDLIAIAHTPGGMMEIVVALLALESGLITPAVFVAIVFSAVFSSVLAGPWMARSLARRAAVAPAQFLAPEAVVAELDGTRREAVIRELAARLAESPESLSDTVLADLAMAREAELGTAVGEGLAIPHVRLEGLKDPVLAVGRSRPGLEWNTPDGVPVQFVFFLVTPVGTEDVHVQALAAIAACMSVRENRQQLLAAADAQALYGTLQALLGKAGRAPTRGADQRN
jgi:mannitol/fructose-specific phosphotransferase system IIA component (Ntr-type)